MSEKVQYIKIEPEYRKEFIEGVEVYFQNECEDIKKANRNIAVISGTQYDPRSEKGLERTVMTAPLYAQFLLGEIDRETLMEESITIFLSHLPLEEGRRKANLMMSLGGSEMEKLGPSPRAIELDVKAFNVGMSIAKRVRIPLKEVLSSEIFRREIKRNIYGTVEGKRKECFSVLDEKLTWFPTEEISIKKWVLDEKIDPKEIEDLKENLRYFPKSARFRAYKIAIIIANEEEIAEIFGDSPNQKLKREKLYEVMEYYKSKA